MTSPDCTSPTTPAPNGATVPAEYVTCPRCHGDGMVAYYGHGQDFDCPQCGGEGQVVEARRCDECGEAYDGDGAIFEYWTHSTSTLCPACAAEADADPVNWTRVPVVLQAPAPTTDDIARDARMTAIEDAIQAADDTLPDWRIYRGPAIRDGNGGWLVWRTNAKPAGYYPAACPSTNPATARRDTVAIGRGLTAAQCAEMAADYAAMAVQS